jgi:DNA anti-recombination protein RmuC
LFQIAVPERLGVDVVALADHQKLMQVRQEAAQRASHQIHQGVERFVADCVAALREQTAQLCDEMLQSINESETGVHQKTLNRLVRFIDEFKEMNFVNDTEMEQRLQAVRKELLTKTAEEYRDNASARAKLVNGLSRLREQANQLARGDATDLVQRFGEMGRRKFNLAA